MRGYLHRLVIIAAFTLFIGEAALGQQVPTRVIELDSIRAAAGESRSVAAKRQSDSIATITSVKVTPALTYPITVDVVSETGRQRFEVGIPPAAPPGEYTVNLYGVGSDGRPLSANLIVTVDPVTVQAGTTANPVPVILLNGWQASCPQNSDSTLPSSQTFFGSLYLLLQQDGIPVVFFNNCFYQIHYGVQPIEGLADQLKSYVSNLQWSDGTPVTQVDLVGHSMGGLIARAYLAGKSQGSGSLVPPANPKVRKLITIATPHFGSFQAVNVGVQSPEMVLGSQFLWDLATWNQGQDDLRGVDALAIVGNAGNYFSPAHADDGVVSLTSASLSFAGFDDQRTRIVPYCHTAPGLFVTCPSDQLAIAYINNPSHLTAQIVRSFLGDTAAWRSIGHTPSQDPFLSQFGGAYIVLEGSNDLYFNNLTSVKYDNGAGTLNAGPYSATASIYYKEFIPAGQHTFTMNYPGYQATGTGTVLAGGSGPHLFKFGPVILTVRSTISTGLPGLTVASGSTIIVSGSGLSSSAATQLSANGTPLTISQLSDQQITAYLPPVNSLQLVKLAVANGNGQHTVNIMAAPPSVIFPQVAIGGSNANGVYSTVFTLINTGSDPLIGHLTLTRQDGTPLNANISSAQASFNGSSIPVSILPGQTTFLTARTVNPSDTTLYTGWGKVESSGGTLVGVATFQVNLNGALQSIAGVLPSKPVSAATIPVDDDVNNGRFTGYAVANTSSSSITIGVNEVGTDGRIVITLTDIPLAPGQQKAAFFFQDPKANQIFKGSAVLTGRNGAAFAVVALVVDQNLLTAIPVIPATTPNPANITFAHLAIGGGYSTVFTLLNTGSDALNGNLILTGQDGNPLGASLTDGQTFVTGSNLPVAIPPGGAKFVTVTSTNKTDPRKAGWARVPSTGGILGGITTFQLTGLTGALQTIAGVLSSAPVSVATLPVDDDTSANRFTGFAIANPGSSPINIKVEEVSADGTTITVLSALSVDPGKQVASFLFQDPKARQKFQGSLVLIGQNGATFCVVGLVQNQGLFTAIPVVPGKAPNIN